MKKTNTKDPDYCIKLLEYWIQKNQGRLGIRKIDDDEAFSKGLIGLAIAIRDYDPEKCVVSFNREVYRQISIAVFKSHSYSGNTGRRASKTWDVNNLRQMIYTRTGRKVSDEELAELIGVAPKIIQDLQRDASTSSLDKMIENAKGDDDSVGSMTVDEKAISPIDAGSLNKKYETEVILECLNELPDEQRKVVKLFFGIDVSRPFVPREIQILLKVSRHKVRLNLKAGLITLLENPRLCTLAETIEGLYVRAAQTDVNAEGHQLGFLVDPDGRRKAYGYVGSRRNDRKKRSRQKQKQLART